MDRRRFLKVAGTGLMGLAVAPFLPKLKGEKDYETSVAGDARFKNVGNPTPQQGHLPPTRKVEYENFFRWANGDVFTLYWRGDATSSSSINNSNTVYGYRV